MASQKRSLKAKVEFKQALHDVFHSQLEAEASVRSKGRKRGRTQADLERKERFFERRKVDISKKEARRVLDEVSAAGGRIYKSTPDSLRW